MLITYQFPNLDVCGKWKNSMKSKLLVVTLQMGQLQAKKAEEALHRSTEASIWLHRLGCLGKIYNPYSSLSAAVRKVLAPFERGVL